MSREVREARREAYFLTLTSIEERLEWSKLKLQTRQYSQDKGSDLFLGFQDLPSAIRHLVNFQLLKKPRKAANDWKRLLEDKFLPSCMFALVIYWLFRRNQDWLGTEPGKV